MRTRILDLLAENQGEFVSGERISEELEITRAGVWKQIKSLKEAGFAIEGQTRRGYRLLNAPVGLDEWVLKHKLKTEKFGHKILLFDEVSSTNELAKEKARQGLEHGALVIGRRQTAGRGRMQRVWESPEGGLWMSLVLKPNLSLAEASKITLAAGIALVEAFETLYNLKCEIKWPNDVVYKGCKIAGILGEVVGEWTSIQTIILGIGINANLKRSDLPSNLTATTLWDVLGVEVNLNELAAVILEHLEKEINTLMEQGFEVLREHWLARAVALGQEVIVKRAGEEFRGVLKGISAEGELILEFRGEEMTFSAGEVSLRSNTKYI